MHRLAVLLGGVAALLLSVPSARADIAVRFTEAAPKDRFVVTNRTGCTLAAGSITIDLGPSRAGLLFDTDPSGPGENVAQPVEIARTQSVSASLPDGPAVADGATTAEIRFRDFLPGGEIEVTVDVDDSIPSGPRGVQMIDGSEIAGARVTLAMYAGAPGPDAPKPQGTGSAADGAGGAPGAVFDDRGGADIGLTGCPKT